MASLPKDVTRILFVTANIATCFEQPDSMVVAWMDELLKEIFEREMQRQQVRQAAINDVQREEYRDQQRNLTQQRKENMDVEQRAQYRQQQRNLSQQRRENMDEE
ncbi:MHC classes I/II-like antigen recognition protein [Trinorchestia longiramus]|nr:MHC classes I/II-like antigen recognition protein [Trinorchestia longiramus]